MQYTTSNNKIGKLDDLLDAMMDFMDTTPFQKGMKSVLYGC
jgi:hypothetical protein